MSSSSNRGSMTRNHGRCCCVFTCLASSAGIALVFLGVFLALLGLSQSSDHYAVSVSGYALAGAGSVLLLVAAWSLFCASKERGEAWKDFCLHYGTRPSQVAAAKDDDEGSISSLESYYEPMPELRVIPPTPNYVEVITDQMTTINEDQTNNKRPETPPEKSSVSR